VLPAEAVLAADAQGKFWELHDLILANQDDLSQAGLTRLAERAGLDVAAFTRALDQHAFAAQVDADKASGLEAGVEATPTFVINGKKLVGNRGIALLRAAVAQALGQ
jgi:protein-disulfide isomerase